MGLTDSGTEDFNRSGLLRLTTIDWTNVDHQRSVAASLVQGVYFLERHCQQQQRQDPSAPASPWWEFFHFRLHRQLKDDADFSIFGAIYEFKPPVSHCNLPTAEVPRYVIAFRGTMITPDTITRDFSLILKLIRNELHEKSRFDIALQAVIDMFACAGNSNVWLAGHSLGSALAMLAGKTMVREGINLEAFLFNPPFVSAPIESIKNERVKEGLRVALSGIKAALVLAVKKNHHNNGFATEDPFVALSAWGARLYVNRADPICSGYAGYFEQRTKMEKYGAGRIESLATQHSLRSLMMNAMGKESEPSHLIPSAILTINATPSLGFRKDHGIDQWWKSDLPLQSKRHTYR